MKQHNSSELFVDGPYLILRIVFIELSWVLVKQQQRRHRRSVLHDTLENSVQIVGYISGEFFGGALKKSGTFYSRCLRSIFYTVRFCKIVFYFYFKVAPTQVVQVRKTSVCLCTVLFRLSKSPLQNFLPGLLVSYLEGDK